jgi:putative hydrolase of the HAD superfamily
MSSRYKAILFDVGMTLIQPRFSDAEICAAICAQHGYSVPLAQIEEEMSNFTETLVARYREKGDLWASEEGVREFFVQLYAECFEALGLPQPRELAAAVYQRAQLPENWSPFPEVMGLLAELKERGLILGVVSDWGDWLPDLLLSLGLTRYLDFVIVSAVVGATKSTPHFFQLALQRAGVRANEALYVGDTYQTDILGARAAGLRPILLDRSGSAPTIVDCPVMGSLEEIWEFL